MDRTSFGGGRKRRIQSAELRMLQAHRHKKYAPPAISKKQTVDFCQHPLVVGSPWNPNPSDSDTSPNAMTLVGRAPVVLGHLNISNVHPRFS